MPPRDEPPPRDTATTTPTATLFEIFWLFNRISSMSFGGGVSAWIYREVVEQKKWISQADFLSALTLAQVLPGINTMNLAVYTGQRLRGVAGSVAAALGLVTVPFFAVLLLAWGYASIQSVPGVQHFLTGIGAAAVGLLLYVGVRAVQATTNTGALVVIATLAVLIGILKWPMIPVALCVAPVSIWLASRETDDNGDEGQELNKAPTAPHA